MRLKAMSKDYVKILYRSRPEASGAAMECGGDFSGRAPLILRRVLGLERQPEG
jgi:hypothetical protein